tara:strand:- start:464 stop:655 length:192 start_codon:yes stop_codon:yes gene_type:complete
MPRHCRHPNKFAVDPEFEEICCYCGKIMEIQKAPVEGHGGKAPWLYKAVRLTAIEEECPKREE